MIQRKIILISGCLFLAALTASQAAQTVQKSLVTPIRQVDHILIEANDPHYLYSFFTETLQLPVAWPIADYATFASGGVAFGNVNVEVGRFPGQTHSPPVGQDQARFFGFAFEPSPLTDTVPELERRKIAYDQPEPFPAGGAGESKQTLWTTVTLSQFSGSATKVFLCEYNPSFNDVTKNRERSRQALLSRKGGPLGVEYVKEMTYGTTDLGASKQLWQRLLEPSQPSATGVWKVGGGPAIHLVPAKENAIQGLVIHVRSLSDAKVFLQEKGLLGRSEGGEVTVEPSRAHGLRIILDEKP